MTSCKCRHQVLASVPITFALRSDLGGDGAKLRDRRLPVIRPGPEKNSSSHKFLVEWFIFVGRLSRRSCLRRNRHFRSGFGLLSPRSLNDSRCTWRSQGASLQNKAAFCASFFMAVVTGLSVMVTNTLRASFRTAGRRDRPRWKPLSKSTVASFCTQAVPNATPVRVIAGLVESG